MRAKRRVDLIYGISIKLNSIIVNIIFILIFILLACFTPDIAIKVVFIIYTTMCLLFAIRDYKRYKYLKTKLDGK